MPLTRNSLGLLRDAQSSDPGEKVQQCCRKTGRILAEVDREPGETFWIGCSEARWAHTG